MRRYAYIIGVVDEECNACDASHSVKDCGNREVEELLAERGLWVDHVTVWRWVQRYAPELQRRLLNHVRAFFKSPGVSRNP